MDTQVSSSKPFGLRTFVHGADSPVGIPDPIKLYGSQRVTWVARSEIEVNSDLINQWKVLMTAVQGTSATVETMFLSRPIVGVPGTACTETYVLAGVFNSESEATSLASYLRTRFARFLVSLRKSTQHATGKVYAFVPIQVWDHEWTDEMLYEKYGITNDEIGFIESIVRPMEVE